MKSISEMNAVGKRKYARKRRGNDRGTRSAASSAAGAVERALGTHAPDRGARMAMAAVGA